MFQSVAEATGDGKGVRAGPAPPQAPAGRSARRRMRLRRGRAVAPALSDRPARSARQIGPASPPDRPRRRCAPIRRSIVRPAGHAPAPACTPRARSPGPLGLRPPRWGRARHDLVPARPCGTAAAAPVRCIARQRAAGGGRHRRGSRRQMRILRRPEGAVDCRRGAGDMPVAGAAVTVAMVCPGPDRRGGVEDRAIPRQEPEAPSPHRRSRPLPVRASASEPPASRAAATASVAHEGKSGPADP